MTCVGKKELIANVVRKKTRRSAGCIIVLNTERNEIPDVVRSNESQEQKQCDMFFYRWFCHCGASISW